MPRKALTLSALAIIVLLLTFSTYTLLSKLAVIEIRSDRSFERAIVTCGSKLAILFNNSVTGSPVMLLFEVCGNGFQGVGVVADEATLEYYTSGVVDMNSSIKAFKSGTLKYCSSQGVKVLVGANEFSFKDTCVTLTVKPYISLQS